MLTKERSGNGHIDRIVVDRSQVGWAVTTERDGSVISCKTFTDWHRVERALQWFDAMPLTAQ